MKRGAIILCGGQSERMGADKANLPFGPERMLQRVVRLVAKAVPLESIAIVSSSGQDLPQLPDKVIVTQDRQSGRGPLEGLACGLTALPQEVDAAYLTGCDTPFVSAACIEQLFSSLDQHDLVVPQENEFYHPLSAIYRRSLLTSIESALAANQFAMHKFIEQQDAKEIPVEQLRIADPELRSLQNLNTLEDYQAALKLAGFSNASSKHSETDES